MPKKKSKRYFFTGYFGQVLTDLHIVFDKPDITYRNIPKPFRGGRQNNIIIQESSGYADKLKGFVGKELSEVELNGAYYRKGAGYPFGGESNLNALSCFFYNKKNEENFHILYWYWTENGYKAGGTYFGEKDTHRPERYEPPVDTPITPFEQLQALIGILNKAKVFKKK